MLNKSYNSFSFALRGLQVVWNEELNFRIEVLSAIFVSFSLFYFKFTFIESAFCVIAMTFVLCAEIINTAIEDICNKIESNHDPMIGKIKDIAGAFVLFSVFGAIIVGGLVFYNHFMI